MLARSLQRLSNIAGVQRTAMFSSYFKELDKASFKEINNSYNGTKSYTKAVNLWKVPLMKKEAKRIRKALNPPTIVPDEESGEGVMYVHNPEAGITLPNHPE